MTKRKVLLFAVMVAVLAVLFAVTAFAANEPVSYKVQTDNGVLERTTTVGVLFNVVNSDGKRVIKGLNDKVDGFSSSKIIEVHIPNGINTVNIDTENSSVQTVIFDYYCQAQVTSLAKFKGLKTIIVSGVESRLTFGTGCVPLGFTDFIVTAPRTELTFSQNAFKDITSLKNFQLRAGDNSASKYSFLEGSLQNTGIESLDLPSGAVTYTFSGAGIFSNCTKLKYVHLGEAVTTVNNTMFENCSALEMVYAEGVTSIADYSFRTTVGEKSDLKVYIHSGKKATVGLNAFNGRSTKGVILCALDLSTTSLSNCKYEIHFGVQHKHMPASDKPTCYTSYMTDCPCGRVANVYYKLYQSGKGVETIKYVAGSNPDVPHSFTSAYKLEYPNGIDNPGVAELKCGVCGTLEGVTREFPPVVEFPGYSVSEAGDKSMVVCVRYNYDALKKYEEINGEELDYGLVMAGYTQLGGNNPITSEGEAYSSGVYNLKMSSLGLYETTLKLTNLKDTMLDTEFIMSAYIKIGDRIVYIQGEGEKEKPEPVSYSKLLK